MILLASANGELTPWSSGSAAVILGYDHPTGELPLAVRVRFGSLSVEWALLDTGSEWSIIGQAEAQRIRGELDGPLGSMTLSSRRGLNACELHRVGITLIADEGADAVIDGTVLVANDWHGPNIVGVRGALERLRIAIDPGGTAEPRLLFSAAG